MLLHQVELRQALLLVFRHIQVLFTDDCKNYEYNEDFVEERADMIRMNPNAFGPKCLELVCECLKHEVRCTAKFRRIECRNGPGIKKNEYNNSNTETDHCDASGLTYEESTMENTTQYEETSNRNKRPRNF